MTCHDYDPAHDELHSDDGLDRSIKTVIRDLERLSRCRTVLRHAYLDLTDREMRFQAQHDSFLYNLIEARKGDLSSKRRRVEAVKEAIRSFDAAHAQAKESMDKLLGCKQKTQDELDLTLALKDVRRSIDEVKRTDALENALRWMEISVDGLKELCERSIAVESGPAA